jgi:O-antigen ligase
VCDRLSLDFKSNGCMKLVHALLLYCATISHVSVECASIERDVVRPLCFCLSCVCFSFAHILSGSQFNTGYLNIVQFLIVGFAFHGEFLFQAVKVRLFVAVHHAQESESGLDGVVLHNLEV